jgi:uncharacterized protein YigA (DUF484 family)
MHPSAKTPPDKDKASVAAYLRAHPAFLAEHPDLYRALVPPARVHGEALADHMDAMLSAERTHAAALARRADGVLSAGRASAGMTLRVQAAVLALMRAADPADCVAQELPGLLAVDAARLSVEAGDRPLPPGLVATVLGHRDVVFRSAPPRSALLHGEAAALARCDALVRVPGEIPMLLALAARDPASLDPSQGSGPLAFLGRAIAAALGR